MVDGTYKVEKPLTIQEKIAQAQQLNEYWGKQLRSDPTIVKLAASFVESSNDTWQLMHDLGVVTICRECEETFGGSCCGAGIENKYNDVLLLLNLLLDVSLPQSRPKERSCYFLGNHGCMLKARHALCINYLCLRIQKSLSQDDFIRLQHAGGEEVDALFTLYEELKKKLRRYTDG